MVKKSRPSTGSGSPKKKSATKGEMAPYTLSASDMSNPVTMSE